jgi:mycofactocin precursor
MSETTIEATAASTDVDADEELEAVEEELLVEEVSIDGMCGVY